MQGAVTMWMSALQGQILVDLTPPAATQSAASLAHARPTLLVFHPQILALHCAQHSVALQGSLASHPHLVVGLVAAHRHTAVRTLTSAVQAPILALHTPNAATLQAATLALAMRATTAHRVPPQE